MAHLGVVWRSHLAIYRKRKQKALRVVFWCSRRKSLENPYTVIIRTGSKFSNLKRRRELTALKLQQDQYSEVRDVWHSGKCSRSGQNVKQNIDRPHGGVVQRWLDNSTSGDSLWPGSQAVKMHSQAWVSMPKLTNAWKLPKCPLKNKTTSHYHK